MFHESHASISRPALLVVVADNVLIVRIRVFRQVSLDQVSSFFCCEPVRNKTYEKRYDSFSTEEIVVLVSKLSLLSKLNTHFQSFCCIKAKKVYAKNLRA